jgi:hypothetical protein
MKESLLPPVMAPESPELFPLWRRTISIIARQAINWITVIIV